MMNRLFFCFALGAIGCGSGDGASSGMSPATTLRVSLGASTATYPHQDALASQTATQVRAGVRSLELIDDQGTPWPIYTAQGEATTVSYDNGARTQLTELEPSALKPGKYVRARLVQEWSRFDITATLHDGTTTTSGTLSVLQVTSDGTSMNGTMYDGGDYEHSFAAAGQQPQSFTGAAPIPDHSTTAEAEAHVESGAWAVYFPVDIQITDQSLGTLSIVANMDHAFRWTDLSSAGYQDAVYDIAPPLYEVVEQFGANRFDVALTP